MNRHRFSDSNGNLDRDLVISAMRASCPELARALVEAGEEIQGLAYLEVATIARQLGPAIRAGNTRCAELVMTIAEDVLRHFNQEGRDFIGAGMLEGVPDADERELRRVALRVAPPLTQQLMNRVWSRF